MEPKLQRALICCDQTWLKSVPSSLEGHVLIRLEAGAGDAMVDHERHTVRHRSHRTAVKTKTITKDSEVKAEIVISFLKRNLDFSSGEAETEDAS